MPTTIPGMESVIYDNREIACVYRADIKIDGVQFLTDNDNPFQIGMQQRNKGTTLAAHIHKIPTKLEIHEIQEYLYIVTGSIKVTLLTEQLKVIDTVTLKQGDSILLKSQAHRVEFLDNARIIELKQGPYPGKENAKQYLE